MKLHCLENRAGSGFTTFGGCWEKGKVTSESEFSLKDINGNEIPVQSRVTAYWPDGSVKWSAHTAECEKMGNNPVLLPCEKSRKEERTCVLIENDTCITVQCGTTSAVIPKQGTKIIKDIYTNGKLTAEYAEEILVLEERKKENENNCLTQTTCLGYIKEVTIEEAGPLYAMVKVSGIHRIEKTGEEKLPFSIYMSFFMDSPEIKVTHNFLYDGDENKDFLKGIGLQFTAPIEGPIYNRHIRFGMDHGFFKESPALLLSWHPRVPEEIYKKQINGEFLSLDPQKDKEALTTAGQIPIWGEYVLYQDSAAHYVIRKKISNDDCCYIEGVHGTRAMGIAAFGGENGGLMLGLKDFWQKYPSTLDVRGMDQDQVKATVWFWSPEAEAMDFRHYATTGYSQSYYEGFDVCGATPYGIGNTNEIVICGFNGEIPKEEKLYDFAKQVQKPAVYVESPEYYHNIGVFGRWSLPKRETKAEQWLEDQMDKTIEFYKKEIEVRNWYGIFNYGDFMHTYDKTRHSWRYDMGGYAWQNTELVPTLWLWYSFLRTGREDIYTLAEAMSRHCAEVDTYHLGPYRGIGSRHNVRHWGCSCKEARIAMAGHHRFYYYLTGDFRMADVFEDVKDGDFALLNVDPLRFFFDKDKMVYPTHARSGPDWSSFCSNWLTRWERFDDKKYLDKLMVGINDLKDAPLKLVSGSDFEYNPEDGHLRYIGERATGGTHLQICMGATETWIELSELLGDSEWTKMLADFGRFYYLPREKQVELSNGMINDRTFSYPFMAAAIAAFGAEYYKDHELGRKIWTEMRRCLNSEVQDREFQAVPVKNAGNQEVLNEIPGVSTNVVSQWCLNVLVALDMIREDLPQTIEELD